MNDWLIQQISSFDNQIALVFDKKKISYNELYDLIEAYYVDIKEKLHQGDIVSILGDYSVSSIALFFALYKHKCVIVPITSKNEIEIKERMKVAGCNYSIKIYDSSYKINSENNILPSHIFTIQLKENNKSGLILFSSGSTGSPKAMIHDLDNLINSFYGKKGKKLVFLIFLMFDHIGGLNTLLNCLSMGVTMVFPITRNPDDVCSIIEREKINILPASPTFLNLILISDSHLKHDLSSLRMITYGTEPMPESLLLKLKNSFPKIKFLQTFGTSETGITSASSKSSESTFIKIEDPNTEFKIVDGELWIRSKTQILGYLNATMERFSEEGWFKTGDLVEEIEDGFIRIIGRNTEIINVGGEKVLPSEIESVLFQMQGIKDCVVHGESNPITGQMVVARILFDQPIKVTEAKRNVTAFCIDKLDRYKIPSKIVLMTESEFSERYKKKRI